jgi:peptidoglycan hydrolase CwlO-like protein
MFVCPRPLPYRRARGLALLTVFILLSGCVSSSTFEDFKHEIRRDITSLQNEQSRLEREIATVRDEIRRISNRQQDLNMDVQDWLTKSETKLKEMEDRVIEIRLQIQRSGGATLKK